MIRHFTPGFTKPEVEVVAHPITFHGLQARESRGHLRLTTQDKRHIPTLPTPAREGGQRQTEKEIK